MPSVGPRLALLSASAAAAAGTGCERDSEVTAQDGRGALSVREYRIDPQSVVADAGALRLTVRNAGIQEHRIAVGEARSSVAVTPVLAPGRSARLVARLPPGEYRLFCTLSDHDTLGMYGKITVR